MTLGGSASYSRVTENNYGTGYEENCSKEFEPESSIGADIYLILKQDCSGWELDRVTPNKWEIGFDGECKESRSMDFNTDDVQRNFVEKISMYPYGTFTIRKHIYYERTNYWGVLLYSYLTLTAEVEISPLEKSEINAEYQEIYSKLDELLKVQD